MLGQNRIANRTRSKVLSNLSINPLHEPRPLIHKACVDMNQIGTGFFYKPIKQEGIS
jgi:hypothetical protein